MSIRKRRILAAFFDYILLLMIIGCLSNIPTKSIWIGRLEISLLFFIETIVIPMYIAFKDLIFRNASLGKKIFRIEIISKETLNAPAVKTVLIRNIVDIVPVIFWLDLVMLFMGKEKYSDKWFVTSVALKRHN